MGLIRDAILRASESRWLRRQLRDRRFMRRSVERFLPGETLEDALGAAAELNRRGITSVLTYLGENVESVEEAEQVTAHYVDAVDRVAQVGLDAELSVKLTQLGLDVSADRTAANVDRIAARAGERDNFVWIDMESSRYLKPTVELYRELRPRRPNLGICLQAYLFRTEDDLSALLPLDPAVRLVKGAYKEPPEIAHQTRDRVDESYLEHAERLLDGLADGGGLRAAFATHDTGLIEKVRTRAESIGLPHDAYEFQMLYGIRRDEQARLAAEGHGMRVLISYGDAWFPWFMRRLAERPANLSFLLRNLF